MRRPLCRLSRHLPPDRHLLAEFCTGNLHLLHAVGLDRAIESDKALTHVLSTAFGQKTTCSFHVNFFNKNKTAIERVRAFRAKFQFGGIHETQAQKQARKDHAFGGALESDKQKQSRENTAFGGVLESEKQKQSKFGGALESDKQKQSKFGGALESDKQKQSRKNTAFGGALESDKQKQSKFGGALESEKQKRWRERAHTSALLTRLHAAEVPVHSQRRVGPVELQALRNTADQLRRLVAIVQEKEAVLARLDVVLAEIAAAEQRE